MFGKPHKSVSLFKKNQKTLVIGDNLNTDIKGANNMKLTLCLLLVVYIDLK